MTETIVLGFVTSAFNEVLNLEELHRRCRQAHAKLQEAKAGKINLEFSFIVADNDSRDGSLDVLERICRDDPDVVALANRSNYGPEASAVNALARAGHCDLVILLCSDLQDPPELVVGMGQTLLESPELDAVLAVKKRSSGGPLLRMARKLYYRALGYSSRLQLVPGGFHGFGCYRRTVVDDALHFWESTDLNFRQCLANASQSPTLIDYEQSERRHGVSSYRGWGYWTEAIRSLVSSDAAASRLAVLIGTGGLLLSLLVGLLLLANVMRGSSGYEGGIPTVMGLVLLSFALQMLMFGLLSRQIEALRMGGFRPRVRFRELGAGNGRGSDGRPGIRWGEARDSALPQVRPYGS
jgi:glycosyltransferase involved in cell wall biosynthesis